MKNIIKIMFIPFIFMALYSSSKIFGEERPIYIGILETRNAGWPNWPIQGEKIEKKIRVAFIWKNNTWSSLEKLLENETLPQDYPTNMTWTIAFDGQNLGTISSQKGPLQFKINAKNKWMIPREQMHILFSGSKVPVFGIPTNEFSGWIGGKYERPLVVVSDKNFADPQNWKPFIPTSDLITIIKPHYINYLQERSISEPSKHKIRLLKSYASSNGNALVHVNVDKLQDESSRPGTWFFISKTGRILNLSQMVDSNFIGDKNNPYDFTDDDDSQMNLIDAGDYNSDGLSEIIFTVSRYDRDSYVLFFNDFTNLTEFGWIYH